MQTAAPNSPTMNLYNIFRLHLTVFSMNRHLFRSTFCWFYYLAFNMYVEDKKDSLEQTLFSPLNQQSCWSELVVVLYLSVSLTAVTWHLPQARPNIRPRNNYVDPQTYILQITSAIIRPDPLFTIIKQNKTPGLSLIFL